MEDGFASLDVMRVLTDFEAVRQDFNDLVIAALCRSKNLTLVTDDEDFSAQGFPILTANASLASKG